MTGRTVKGFCVIDDPGTEQLMPICRDQYVIDRELSLDANVPLDRAPR
jgi:hypothetical protein